MCMPSVYPHMCVCVCVLGVQMYGHYLQWLGPAGQCICLVRLIPAIMRMCKTALTQ